jgi:hypothetical protein
MARTSPIPPIIHYVQLAAPAPPRRPLLKFLQKVKRFFQWKMRNVSGREAGLQGTNSMAADDTETLADTYESDFRSSLSGNSSQEIGM